MKFELSEKQLGYLMVAPALILVIMITLWPVAQSFYNSLFDYRLNDPSRSERFVESNVDLERYANDFFYLSRDLEGLAGQAPNEEAAEVAKRISADIEGYHEALLATEGLSKQYEEVEGLLASFTAISDGDLKYATIDKDFAKEYKEFLTGAEKELTALSQNTEDEAFKTATANIVGSISSSNKSIIESNFIGLSNYSRY